MRKAQSLDPTNQTIQQELQRLQKKSETEAKHEKNLYKKMLGQPITPTDTNKVKEHGKKSGTKVIINLILKLKEKII